MTQIRRILLEAWFHFEHHMILVQLREHGRYQSLAECVVQRIVDHGGRNAEAGSRIAIVDEIGPKTQHLLIARHVAKLGQLPQLIEH